MNAVTWALDHWELIGTLLGIFFGVVEIVRASGSLRQGLLSLMLQAEKESAKGSLPVTGPAIMRLVVELAMERVVPQLPLYIRPFVTEARVRQAALWVYEQTRQYLHEGKLTPGGQG